MKGLTDYKIICQGENLPKKVNYPLIEIYDEDFSIFGIEEYNSFQPRSISLDFDTIYREDSKCTFTDLKAFVSAYIENFKAHMICNNEYFVEKPVSIINDSKELDVSIFYKLIHPEPNSVYADILLIVEKMDFS